VSYGTFSHASDVWSYGVTLWEMYSFGQQPYDDVSGQEAADFVSRGGRLAQPYHCQQEIYRLMLKCWSVEPADRPTFAQLVNHFTTNVQYGNVQDLLMLSNQQSTA
jgi:tyrosine-protein kinase shark